MSNAGETITPHFGGTMLTPNVSVSRLFNGRGFGMTITSGSEEDTTRLYQHAIETINNWPTDRPLLALLQFSLDSTSVTNYTREVIEEITTHTPPVNAYFAVVLNADLLISIAGHRVATQTLQNYVDRELRFFQTRHEAMTWLEKRINLPPK